MSRIGKMPVKLPQGVKLEILANQAVLFEGQKGKLELKLPNDVKVVSDNGEVRIESQQSNLQGLVKALVDGAVKGVNEGWNKSLELNGTGYRAAVSGNQLQLNLGFSHQVVIEAPSGIAFSVKENKITVSGVNKVLVGQVAAKIKHLKPADVYKAKGFKYEGEVILRKPGKAAKAGATK
jgi:large subunit ribosomal protein L6